MLQAVIGGYSISGVNTFYSAPNTYLEPGFNTFNPLSLSVSNADEIYILLRRRTNITGTTFAPDNANDYTVIVKDLTNGNDLDYTFVSNSLINNAWHEGGLNLAPFVLTVESKSTSTAVFTEYFHRLIEIFVVHDSTGQSLLFHILMTAPVAGFTWLTVQHDKYDSRPTSSSNNSKIEVEVGGKGAYVLLSPNSTIVESIQESANFSFGSGIIFYSRTEVSTDEGFTFEIDNVSHDFISEYCDISGVPEYLSVGVLSIDAAVRSRLDSVAQDVYFCGISVGGDDLECISK